MNRNAKSGRNWSCIKTVSVKTRRGNKCKLPRYPSSDALSKWYYGNLRNLLWRWPPRDIVVDLVLALVRLLAVIVAADAERRRREHVGHRQYWRSSAACNIFIAPTHAQFSISRNPNDAIRCTHLSADLTHPDSVGSDYPEHLVFPGGWASSVVACPCLVPVASWWPMTVCTGPWSSASNLIWWSWNALVQNVHHLRHCYWFPFYYRRLKHHQQQQRHLIKTKGTIRIRRIKWLNKLH